jgi:hypothetical protein
VRGHLRRFTVRDASRFSGLLLRFLPRDVLGVPQKTRPLKPFQECYPATWALEIP